MSRVAAATTIAVATDNQNNTGVMVPGRSEPVTIGTYQIDEGYLDAMGMTLVAGRWFDDRRPMDDMTLPFPPDLPSQRALATRGANIVINELAARRLGFNNPAELSCITRVEHLAVRSGDLLDDMRDQRVAAVGERRVSTD